MKYFLFALSPKYYQVVVFGSSLGEGFGVLNYLDEFHSLFGQRPRERFSPATT
jgi:hypothetical protein